MHFLWAVIATYTYPTRHVRGVLCRAAVIAGIRHPLIRPFLRKVAARSELLRSLLSGSEPPGGELSEISAAADLSVPARPPETREPFGKDKTVNLVGFRGRSPSRWGGPRLHQEGPGGQSPMTLIQHPPTVA